MFNRKNKKQKPTYEQLIDKANLCIQAAIRCWNHRLDNPMAQVWYEKAQYLRERANLLPCSEVCK